MPAELVWGLFVRLVGVLYLVAIGALVPQIVGLCGARGLTPVAPILRRMRSDFPAHVRLWHFPSLLWISASDNVLRGLTAAGCLAAGWVIYGGPYSRWALLACFAVWLSLDKAVDLSYPWDAVLFEMGFLSLFVPSIEPLPSLAATAVPLPVVAFGLNLVLVRVLLGFGKLKFSGATRKDHGYLKEFLINQPMPTPLGWRAYHWPGAIHRLGLMLLFLGEIPFPLLALLPGPVRLLPLVTTLLLMATIQLVGNFGYFNLVVAVLCVPLLDLGSSIFAISPAQIVQHPLVHALMAIVLLGWLLFFPFNSWCNCAWTHWPASIGLKPAWLRWLVIFYRQLAALRVVNAYGVFPPQSVPPVKLVLVFQGSDDGQEWCDYDHRLMPATAMSPPRWIAPYHPRWDQVLMYGGLGMSNSGLMCTIFNCHLPYNFTRHGGLERAAQRLLEGEPLMSNFLRCEHFREHPPRLVRIVERALVPTSVEERRTTGEWWKVYPLGLQLGPIERRDEVWLEWLNHPEMFHWDDAVWRRRAPAMQRLEAAAKRASGVEEVEQAIAALLDLGLPAVHRFWSSFLPAAQLPSGEYEDFGPLDEIARAVRGAYGRTEFLELERVGGALAIAMAARHEQRVFGDRFGLPSYLHVGMLMQHVILQGRDCFAAALTCPEVLQSEARRMTDASGLWLWAVFRPGMFRYHAFATKLVRQFVPQSWNPVLPGLPLLTPFFLDQFADVQPDATFHVSRDLASGAWRIGFDPLQT